MCYMCATNAKNTILRAHYAFMAYRSGVPIEFLVDIVNREEEKAGDMSPSNSTERRMDADTNTDTRVRQEESKEKGDGRGEDATMCTAGLGVKELAAITLAEAASYAPSNMTPTLVGLLSRQYTPAGIVELVTTVSVMHMIHRWTSVYVPTT